MTPYQLETALKQQSTLSQNELHDLILYLDNLSLEEITKNQKVKLVKNAENLLTGVHSY